MLRHTQLARSKLVSRQSAMHVMANSSWRLNTLRVSSSYPCPCLTSQHLPPPPHPRYFQMCLDAGGLLSTSRYEPNSHHLFSLAETHGWSNHQEIACVLPLSRHQILIKDHVVGKRPSCVNLPDCLLYQRVTTVRFDTDVRAHFSGVQASRAWSMVGSGKTTV